MKINNSISPNDTASRRQKKTYIPSIEIHLIFVLSTVLECSDNKWIWKKKICVSALRSNLLSMCVCDTTQIGIKETIWKRWKRWKKRILKNFTAYFSSHLFRYKLLYVVVGRIKSILRVLYSNVEYHAASAPHTHSFFFIFFFSIKC